LYYRELLPRGCSRYHLRLTLYAMVTFELTHASLSRKTLIMYQSWCTHLIKTIIFKRWGLRKAWDSRYHSRAVSLICNSCVPMSCSSGSIKWITILSYSASITRGKEIFLPLCAMGNSLRILLIKSMEFT